MRCPDCDAEISPPVPGRCPRCGGALEAGAPDAEAGATERIAQPTRTTSAIERPESWSDVLGAAALAFLVLLCVGAAIVVAVKLQYPSFGSGANPVEILTTIVILGLACLRAPVHVGELTLTALPLGALLAVIAGTRWAARSAGSVTAARGRTPLWIGLAFGLLAAVMALVFRHRTDPDPVHAGVFGSLVWGCLWGWAGARLVRVGSLRTRAAGVLRGGAGPLSTGVTGGFVMAACCLLLAAVASLLWLIGLLGTEGLPRSFGVGDALAGAVYLIAFAPNIALAFVALSVGAPIEVGAQLTLSGRLVGSAESFSLFGWGAGDAPLYAFGLLLIPLLGCGAGGWWLRVSGGGRARNLTLATAAMTFALALALLAWLGEARLGAALAGGRGFGRVSADPVLVALAGGAWALSAGAAGSALAGRRAGGT